MQKFCNKCGSPIDISKKFCPHCGILLKKTNNNFNLLQYNLHKRKIIYVSIFMTVMVCMVAIIYLNNEDIMLHLESSKVGYEKKIDFVQIKDKYNKQIIILANDINIHFSKKGNLKEAENLRLRAERLQMDIAHTINVYKKSDFNIGKVYDRILLELFELELRRASCLQCGVLTNNYTQYFRKGTEATYKYEELNRNFNKSRD